MSTTISFDLRNAWKLTGRHTYRETRYGSEFVNSQRIAPGSDPKFLLGFCWPADWDCLQVAVRYYDPTAQERHEQPFRDDPDLVRQIWPHAAEEHLRCLLAPVGHHDVIVLEFLLDTDVDTFLAENPANAPTVLEKTIQVVAYSPRPDGPGDSKTLRLRVGPLCPMQPFSGLAALDFGNTSSTLVCQDAQGTIQVVDVEFGRLAHKPQPCPTALRVLARTAATGGIAFDQYQCQIGRVAFETDAGGWLVLWAKRLLSDAADSTSNASNGALEIFLEGAPLEIPRREPAELFVAEMLKQFYNQYVSYPQPLVLTCPTTFSNSEVQQLRLAVFQAWRRSRRQQNLPVEPEQVERLAGQVIDEASAAGFYFLYRDFIDAPGRMPGFRYLYPQGMHLLLFDCGGGTTDVSLIKAVASDSRHLQIEVLGRTGHRAFGGDNITTAVFRALKAKLAALLGGPPLPNLDPDSSGFAREWKDFLNNNAAPADQIIPTRFASNDAYFAQSFHDQEVRQRLETALLLWKWAELVKHALSDRQGPVASFPTLPGYQHTRLGELLGLVKHDARWQEIGSGRGLQLTLAEIDAQVDPDILRTLGYANSLLRARLPADTEVEAVYLIGNASRYPRIPQLLTDKEHGLQIRSLTRRMGTVGTDELKNSVAFGALRAQQLREGMLGIHVRFDRQLMERLPYNITCRDLAGVRNRVLFPEHKRYSQLGSAEIEVPVDNTAREIKLYRDWPGDREEDTQPFLEFKFSEPPKGKLFVSFNHQDRRFQMQPENDPSIVVVGTPPRGFAPDTAPIQTGVL